jgi:hypothetical protein
MIIKLLAHKPGAFFIERLPTPLTLLSLIYIKYKLSNILQPATVYTTATNTNHLTGPDSISNLTTTVLTNCSTIALLLSHIYYCHLYTTNIS